MKENIPPHSKENEMMVLGCMLNSINGLNIACDRLHEKDFYYQEHYHLFKLLKESFFKYDRPADLHLVTEEIKRQDIESLVAGLNYVQELSQFSGTSLYTEEYCRLIKDKSILRLIINSSQTIQQEAYKCPEDVHQTLDEAQQLFFKISQTGGSKAGKSLKELFNGNEETFLDSLQKRQEKFQKEGAKTGITGILTHFYDLDKMINGFNNSNLMILAGRPGMGKTALAINIAENICFQSNIPVGIFSLEMSANQLINRIISSQTMLESRKIIQGHVTPEEFQNIVVAVKNMENHHMIIDDQSSLKISDIRVRARRMKESHNIGLLVIDYLQLINASSSKSENRQVEVSEISRGLKNLARDLNIPILCLSQLSRKIEERADHRPMLSDLRESGSIEQDADLVFFIDRKDYYNKDNKPGEAEMIVAKNRHGEIGSFKLTYQNKFVKFQSYAPIQGVRF